MYKILDLRTGTFLETQDIFWENIEAIYASREDAEAAIIRLVEFHRDLHIVNPITFRHEKFIEIKEFYEIINV